MKTADQVQAIVELNRTPVDQCDMVWASRARQVMEDSGMKYLTRAPWAIETRYGDINVHDAMIGDGSSGTAPDRCPEAYWGHDKLYIYPTVIDQYGALRTLNKFQCDLAYASILTHNWMPIDGALSFVGLTLGGFKAWRRYKNLREDPSVGTAMIIEGFTLPHRELWTVPSDNLPDIQFHYAT